MPKSVLMLSLSQPGLRRKLSALGGLALHLLALARQRRQLARLDPELLRDIGLSPEQAETEARRPCWDPPGHWRQ